MRREPHVRFREGGGVKLLSATRPVSGRSRVAERNALEGVPHRGNPFNPGSSWTWALFKNIETIVY
jgi:hypothetical protein